MTKALNVWWDDTSVGVLEQTKGGALEFTYSQHWLLDDHRPPLSLSLPKRAPPFEEKECRPFFAGLLPEEAQRQRIAAAFGVSAGNDFALLDALGEDVAGAIEFLRPDVEPRSKTYDPQTRGLTEAELHDVIEQLPRRPLLAGVNGLRLSLAGAQSKVPVVLVGEDVALPLRGQPTTHILKPSIPEYPGTTENEAFVMRLALAVGLDVAHVEPRRVGDKSFLLVARYDRAADNRGRTRRLHQEDFCQALGVLPQRKYAKEGGPGFKECFALVRTASTLPARDVLALLDAVLLNLIVGNADAHGKNFSLLYKPDQTRLAPLYDLLSTVHYPNLSPDLAMKIGRAGRLGELDDETWRRFSTDTGVAVPAIRRRGNELCAKLVQQLPMIREDLASSGLSEAQFDAVARTISGRVTLAVDKLPKKTNGG